MGKERSAGFLIFRQSNEQIEYLLLKASEMGMHWGPPKGNLFFVFLFVFQLNFQIYFLLKVILMPVRMTSPLLYEKREKKPVT